MLEQEIASIIKYTLVKAGNPSPYYNEVPEGFLVPSAYYPVPEISSRGDTLVTYALEYEWFIKFFHVDTPSAYAMGMAVLTALQGDRRLIPLIDPTGVVTSRGVRVKDPSLKKLDSAGGAVQLHLSWDSPRPYNDPDTEKMMTYSLDMYNRTAFDAAIQQIL